MKISEGQLRKIIREALSEINGVLDNKMHELAQLIIEKYWQNSQKHTNGKNWSFYVTQKEFRNYNVYNVPFKNLKIVIEYNDRGYDAAYYNGSVHITAKLFNKEYQERIESIIEHELLHMIQDLDQNRLTNSFIGYGFDGHHSPNFENNYCFAPHEMAARIQEVYRYVQYQLESYLAEAYFDSNYENPNLNNFYWEVWWALNDDEFFSDTPIIMLHFDEMEELIKTLENEDFETFLTSYREGDWDAAESIVYTTILDPPQYLNKIRSFWRRAVTDEFSEPSDEVLEKLFYEYKQYLLNYYKTTFENYKRKVHKTLFPLVESYFNRYLEEYECERKTPNLPAAAEEE